MTETLTTAVERRNGLAVVSIQGYINNQGGEQVAGVCYQLLDAGCTVLLLNLEGTEVVSSIGISILIEIVEKVMEVNGKLAFCCLTPTIEKTFEIVGLTEYAPIFADEATAIAQLQPA